MIWQAVSPDASMDHLGYIPTFFDDTDKRSAREQVNERYVFGGWEPQEGFTMDFKTGALKYPGDPLMKPYFVAWLHDEAIMVYDYGYVAIVQRDKTFEAARLD